MSEKLRNPTWTEEEHIFLLNFYLRFRPHFPSKKTEEIRLLSEIIKQIHFKVTSLEYKEIRKLPATFRNSDGVSMKLNNFLPSDPDYPGKGLRSTKAMEIIWDRYADNPKKLSQAMNSRVLPLIDPLLRSKAKEAFLLSTDEFQQQFYLDELYPIIYSFCSPSEKEGMEEVLLGFSDLDIDPKPEQILEKAISFFLTEKEYLIMKN